MKERIYRHLGIIGVLLALNIAIFYKHYLGTDMFPWDFWKSYYAMVSFWTTLARHGVIAEWVPYQYMGYPFFLNPQTSFFYPPMWTFVLFHIHYSLHTAAIVQCLHVFWGAYGTYLLVRVLTNDWRSALFGAIAYQFFGGFYSNAEHVDIVRAYAWLPWLFWSATTEGRLLARNYLLPVIIYCAISGSYPGNIGSHLFFLGIYLLGQFYYARVAGFGCKHVYWLFAFTALGLLLSTVVVIPALMMRHYLHHTGANFPTNNWPFQNWLSLITPWATKNSAIKGFIGDPSMISAFIGVPVLALAFLSRIATRLRVWWIILLAGVCLALGQASFLYNALTRVLPVLGLSRFPSSDYRGIIALAFVVLASASFQQWIGLSSQSSEVVAFRRRLAYVSLLPLAILSGVFNSVALPNAELIWLIAIWTLTLAVLYLSTIFRLSSWTKATLLVSLVVFQGMHVLTTSSWTWTAHGTDLDSRYKERLGISTSSSKEPVIEHLNNVPTRPARVTRKRADFSWSGYLLGTFQTGDFSNTDLTAQYQITHHPVLSEFMKRPLTVLVFPNTKEVSREMLLQRLQHPEQEPGDGSQVAPRMYGLNSESYDVTLSGDATIVVNEIWFPGWEGRVTRSTGASTRVTASSVDQAIRAWSLPAGNYSFVTRFRMPYLRTSALVSLIALLAYAGLLLATIRRNQLRSAK